MWRAAVLNSPPKSDRNPAGCSRHPLRFTQNRYRFWERLRLRGAFPLRLRKAAQGKADTPAKQKLGGGFGFAAAVAIRANFVYNKVCENSNDNQGEIS